MGTQVLWFLFFPFVKVGLYLNNARKAARNDAFNKRISKTLFPDFRVQNGPFAGMKYPKMDAVGSSIFPKLLGSYEKELWEVFERLKQNVYTEIIDIGCAEGYYSVGFARLEQQGRVVAVDTDAKARKLCAEMAALNAVAHKLELRSSLTASELASFSFSGRALIISDCEGFEKDLFTASSIANLKNCDVLIETHKDFEPGISEALQVLFAASHTAQIIRSIDDYEKAESYHFPELDSLRFAEKRAVLAENRQYIMDWLLFEPK